MPELCISREFPLNYWLRVPCQYLQQMFAYFERRSKTVLREGWCPGVLLQNTLHGMEQSIDDLFGREVLVCTGEHDLVQACAKEHFEPAKNVCIQRLQQARHPRRYDHWPDVIITARSKRALGEVTFMCIQQ